ncbi:glycosyltransferase family 2 protein [Macellibacteroides fermentans]|uniref:glycosyltransferase family 2 protein n=1 Tax=Macellibacteroides fermentans TaxID=879969 RepID=UPI00352ECCE5
MFPLFSLITVSYNSSKTISDTIQSVLNQTYNDIEYIIVDGNSNDNTIDIIKEFEPKFNGRMHWVSEPDKGLYDAMNKGLKMATGDIVGIINSDDLFCDSEAVLKVVNLFKSNRALDGVYADLYYVAQDDTQKIIRKWVTGSQKPFSTGWHPAHPTLYLRSSVYSKYGLFDLNFRLAADFEIMLRFLDNYKIKVAYLPESFVKMRLGGETNKSIQNIYNQNVECVKSFEKNKIEVNKLLYPLKRLIPKLLQYGK